MHSRSLHSIFCDDVRNEVDGRLSYVGVIPDGRLRVAKFPVRLNVFTVIAQVTVDINDPITSLKVKVLADETVIAISETPAELLAKSYDKSKIDSEIESELKKFASIRVVIAFSGFPVPHAVTISVRAEVNGEELRCPSIRIDEAAKLPVPKPNDWAGTGTARAIP